MLTPEEAYHFDLKGYLVCRGAFPRERVAALAAALESLEGRAREELPPRAHPSWTPVLDEYRLYNAIECADEFLAMIDHPAIYGRVESLVRGPFRLTEAYTISRRRGLGLPLHSQDIAEYGACGHALSTKHAKAVIPLSDCGPDDGPFVVLEGSHKLGVPMPYHPTPPDWQVPEHDAAFARAFLDEGGGEAGDTRRRVPWEEIPGYREVCVRAGDLVLFTEDLWHGGKRPASDRVRRTLFLAYSPYHFTTWHGMTYSDELLGRASERQRRLLAGPYCGSRLAGADRPELAHFERFPYLPDSERAHTAGDAWRAHAAQSGDASR